MEVEVAAQPTMTPSEPAPAAAAVVSRCRVCYTPTTDVYVLPCRHMFCRKCLVLWVGIYADMYRGCHADFPCQICWRLITVPAGSGLDAFRHDLQLQQLEEDLLRMSVVDQMDADMAPPGDSAPGAPQQQQQQGAVQPLIQPVPQHGAVQPLIQPVPQQGAMQPLIQPVPQQGAMQLGMQQFVLPLPQYVPQCVPQSVPQCVPQSLAQPAMETAMQPDPRPVSEPASHQVAGPGFSRHSVDDTSACTRGPSYCFRACHMHMV